MDMRGHARPGASYEHTVYRPPAVPALPVVPSHAEYWDSLPLGRAPSPSEQAIAAGASRAEQVDAVCAAIAAVPAEAGLVGEALASVIASVRAGAGGAAGAGAGGSGAAGAGAGGSGAGASGSCGAAGAGALVAAHGAGAGGSGGAGELVHPLWEAPPGSGYKYLGFLGGAGGAAGGAGASESSREGGAGGAAGASGERVASGEVRRRPKAPRATYPEYYGPIIPPPLPALRTEYPSGDLQAARAAYERAAEECEIWREVVVDTDELEYESEQRKAKRARLGSGGAGGGSGAAGGAGGASGGSGARAGGVKKASGDSGAAAGGPADGGAAGGSGSGAVVNECPLSSGTAGACDVGAGTTAYDYAPAIFGLTRRELLIREKTNEFLKNETPTVLRMIRARRNAVSWLQALGRISPTPDAGEPDIAGGAAGGAGGTGGAGDGTGAGDGRPEADTERARVFRADVVARGGQGVYPADGICPTDPPMEWRGPESPRPRAPSPEYFPAAPSYSPNYSPPHGEVTRMLAAPVCLESDESWSGRQAGAGAAVKQEDGARARRVDFRPCSERASARVAARAGLRVFRVGAGVVLAPPPVSPTRHAGKTRGFVIHTTPTARDDDDPAAGCSGGAGGAVAKQ